MKTGHKVALYGLVLAVIFGGTWAAGAAAGPTAQQAPPAEHNEHKAEPAKVPPGLSVADNGYTLVLHDEESLGFHINGPDGQPVTKFAVEHEKRLHLIVVRRDLTGFQHVHPELGDDGRWTTDVDLEPGTWRVFADFKASDGPALTLGTDLTVPGRLATVHSMTETMAKFLAVGLSLEDVILRTTANPAKALGMADTLGAIAVGREADISVLDVVEGDWEFTDSSGARFKGTQAIIPVVTIRAGEVIAPDWGPHPWGWLPAPGPRGMGKR